MQREAILEHFRNVRRRRPGSWSALCPAHGDEKTPSLVIFVGDDAKLHFHCFTHNCSLTAILAAAGLKMSDVRDNDGKYNSKPEVRRRVVKTYDYRDEAGTLLYQVLRYAPKGFSQRRPDPSYKDGWQPMLGDVRRVLYRLPELLAAPRHPVIVVEGEKDADALASLGLLATCNAGGVGMGWKDEYSQVLTGRRCVIIPDNDAAGLKHSFHVAGSLLFWGAASVRFVKLPEPAKDVSEYLHSGGNLDGLIGLIRAVPETFSRAA